MEYAAAEYFIEALGKSQTFCVNYDFIRRLIEQAPQDVAVYLKKEIVKDGDFLFLFKKFPDVFLINRQTITLTDAFLSLYAFPDSSNFSISHKCLSIFEIDVIEYFKLILSRCVFCHYNLLFDALLSQNSSQLATFFSHYTLKDKYLFFQRHSNTFAVANDNVYLKIEASTKNIQTVVKDSNSSKILKKLTQSTYFLLTCFESLHYIEVKQCVSFVLSDVKEFLNHHSLIKQREIFENMSEIIMDRLGYLTLQNLNVKSVKSRKIRLVILIVCILAFEREMHFEKIFQEVERRCSAEIKVFLGELSKSELYAFFKKFSDYFIIQDSGYVNLLSSFVFPLCAFENALPNLEASQNIKTNAKSVQIVDLQPNSAGTFQNHCVNFSKEMQKPQQQFFGYGCNIQQQQYSTNVSNIDVSNEVGNTNIINVRVELSILYLKAMFDSPVCQYIVKCLLHILDDVRVCFFKLSQADQVNFIKDCYNIFCSTKKPESTLDLLSQSYVNLNEKTLLCVTYLLLSENRMLHFQNISSVLISKNVNSFFSLLDFAGQFYYFKRMDRYFILDLNGYITLNQPFLLVNAVIDAQFHSLSVIQTANTKSSNLVTQDSTKDILSEASKNKVCNSVVDLNTVDVKEEIDVPLTVCDKLHFTILFLQNCFDALIAKHILEAFLHALNPVKEYFSALATKDQHRFISKYFQYISSEDVIKVYPISNANAKSLEQNEECLLFITYLMITKKTSLHYRSIVKELKKYVATPQLLSTTDSNCFKYFRNLSDYFIITGDGFVCLSSTFSSLSSIINCASAFNQEIQKKMNKPIKIQSETNQEIQKKMYKPIKIQSEVLTESKVKSLEIINKDQNLVINIDNTKEKAERNVLLNEEAAVNGELNLESYSTSDIVIDVCISFLSVSEKMQVEKLCNLLKSSGISSIHNYFAFHTVSEKITFFSNLSQYFDITRDGFVSIREHVLQSYVPKTNCIKLDSNGRFVVCSPTLTLLQNKFESLKICDSSDLSDSSNVSNRSSVSLKKSKSKKVQNKNPTMKKIIKIDPSAISKVNNFLSSCKRENINNLDRNNDKISSMSKKFKDLNLLPENQSTKAEKSKSVFLENLAKTKVSQKDVNSNSVVCSQFNIPATEKHAIQSDSFTGKYTFNNSWKTESLDSNQSTSKEPLFLKNKNLTNTEVCLDGNFPKSDLLKTESLKESHILYNEELTNDFVQPHGNFSKSDKSWGKKVAKSDTSDNETWTSNIVEDKDNFIKCNTIKSGWSPLKSSVKIDGTLSKDCLIDDLKTNALEYDSYKSYGTELLNSFLGQLDTDTNLSMFQNYDIKSSHMVAHKQQNSSTIGKLPNTESSKNDTMSKMSDAQNSAISKLGDSSKHCDSSSCLTGDIVELRAINFFCVILGNYDNGLSADFLMQHMNLASVEVQRFLHCHYEENILPFFEKHKKDFYVSPQTSNVYLVKDS